MLKTFALRPAPALHLFVRKCHLRFHRVAPFNHTSRISSLLFSNQSTLPKNTFHIMEGIQASEIQIEDRIKRSKALAVFKVLIRGRRCIMKVVSMKIHTAFLDE